MQNKYKNKKSVIDNVTFDSQKEGRLYLALKTREKVGHIRDLILQPKFEIHAGFVDSEGIKHRAIIYKADFQYFDIEQDKTVVVDAKGFQTDVYKLKKKLFLKQLPKNTIFMEI